MLYPRPGESRESWEARVAKEEKRLLLDAGARPETAENLAAYQQARPAKAKRSRKKK